jgi:hypothetical protein
MSLLALFCAVDDFCQWWQEQQAKRLARVGGQRRRQPRLSESEIMTIIIHFHQSGYRDFKDYYTKHVQAHLHSEFPRLVSYNRFVTLMQRVVLFVWAYLKRAAGHVPGSPLWTLYRFARVYESTHQSPQSLCRLGFTRSLLIRLVLWLQAPFGHQRTWRNPRFHAHTGECR